MGDFSALTLVALVGTALLAGFIDAIAGGGGLLTLPALALAGLDPVTAVATNKMQSTFGSGSATLAFWRAGHLRWADVRNIGLAAGGGAVLGAMALSLVPRGAVEAMLPIVLVVVAVYFALSPALGDRDVHQRMPAWAFTAFFVPVIGAYDGIFGPGTGSFYMLGFVSLMGFGVVRATARTKAANFASNMGGLVTFIFLGHIVWPLGLMMGLAQFAGARLGAHATMRAGARLVKPLLVTMCIALALRLAWASPAVHALTGL